MALRLFMIAVAPGIAIGMILYSRDRYDREPLPLLIKIFLLGALSVIPVLAVEKILLRINVFTGILEIAFTAFVVAGFTEEYFKRAVVLYGAYHSKYFNEKLDGIIYCAFSALGFATVENIMYIGFQFTGNYYVGILRGVLSVPAHVLFAITMGYYLSLSRFATDPTEKKQYFMRSLLVPIVLHGLFNFILMAQIPYGLFIFIPYVIFLWVTSLKKLNEYTHASKGQETITLGDEKDPLIDEK